MWIASCNTILWLSALTICMSAFQNVSPLTFRVCITYVSVLLLCCILIVNLKNLHLESCLRFKYIQLVYFSHVLCRVPCGPHWAEGVHHSQRCCLHCWGSHFGRCSWAPYVGKFILHKLQSSPTLLCYHGNSTVNYVWCTFSACP